MILCRARTENQNLKEQLFSSGASITSWIPKISFLTLKSLNSDALLQVSKMRSPIDEY